MTGLQNSTLNTYNLLLTFMRDHAERLSSLPGFDGLYQKFLEQIEELDRLAVKQLNAVRGYTLDKKNKRAELTKLTLDVSRRVVALAVMEDDPELKSRVKCTEREMTLSRDTEVSEKALQVHSIALDNAERLAGYGVDTALLEKLQGAILVYDKTVNLPWTGISDRHAATVKIGELIKETGATLRKIDILLGLLKLEDPDIWFAYRRERKIIKTGIRQLAMKGMVLDSRSNLGIAGATIEFYEANGLGSDWAKEGANGERQLPEQQPSLVKKSTSKGGFLLRKLPEGTYRVVAHRYGYVTQNLKAIVNHGVMCVMEIRMERVSEMGVD